MDQTSYVYRVTACGFITVLALLLVVAFGLALSRLDDAPVIGVGVVALAAGVLAVMLQGMQVSASLNARNADSISDPHDLPARVGTALEPDRFVVRSYSLMVRPDLMDQLRMNFTSAALVASGVHMTERGFIKCAGVVTRGDISYAADAAFLVVSQSPTSAGFRSDVVNGHVSSIMLGGGLLRIISLSALDFAGDDRGVASTITLGHDVYVLSARGSAGSVPAKAAAGCASLDTFLPWSCSNVLPNVSARNALFNLMTSVQAGVQATVQVWGIGAR